MSYPMFLPNFKILGAVVPEKSLTKKNVNTHTHTDKQCYGKDENYIPPYTLYARGIIKAIISICSRVLIIQPQKKSCSFKTFCFAKLPQTFMTDIFPYQSNTIDFSLCKSSLIKAFSFFFFAELLELIAIKQTQCLSARICSQWHVIAKIPMFCANVANSVTDRRTCSSSRGGGGGEHTTLLGSQKGPT